MNSATPPSGREDRLKAALKANMAKRKAQAKARTTAQQTQDNADHGPHRGETGED